MELIRYLKTIYQLFKIIPPGPCEDISVKCDIFKKYCGKNNYVTKRCLKTCGICSKLCTQQFKRVKSIDVGSNQNLSDRWTCFSAIPDAEAASTTVEAPTPAVCDDTSTKCDEFAKYCRTNTYVKERCQRTCGQCGRSPYLKYYLIKSFEIRMALIQHF